ncbi:GNAT family N-acetyltransferase [Streptomyces sp. NPDC058867]|uniref:GNAT family N-acetyltransferase n=1 Tax=unclassified Streptomyces TaxID=2593676 RepID=UPI003688DFE8
MSWSIIKVEQMDGPAAARAEAAFRSVYAEVFAEPPYHETADGVTAAFRRFRTMIRRPAFRAALARTAEGEPVGMAYGHAVPADTGWWDELTEPVAEDLRREDGHRSFGLMEFAVREPWRGHGIARRLHAALLDQVTAERVLLNVHPESRAASAAYRSWGYVRMGSARPSDWPRAYDFMLLDLAHPAPAGADGTVSAAGPVSSPGRGGRAVPRPGTRP